MRVFFMAKIFVAIDGSNFYKRLKDLGIPGLLDFNYMAFAKWLTRKGQLKECVYYVGQIREELANPKSKSLKRNQDRLFSRLRKQDVTIKTGYILKTNSKYHEKGVDVQIAVDICMKAVRNEYDRLILVSSDTDLIPAVKEVKNLGKIVEYVGFDVNPSFAMMRFSSSRTLLKKEDLLPFTKSPARKRTG